LQEIHQAYRIDNDVPLVRGCGVTNILARTMSEDEDDTGSDHKMIEIEWGRKSVDCLNHEVIAWKIDKIAYVDLQWMKNSWGDCSRSSENLLKKV
jgi:hypothetical protein